MCRLKTCGKCGGNNFVANGKYTRCNTCLIAQRASRYKRRKEEFDSISKSWGEANKEAVKGYKKKWRDANKQEQSSLVKSWREGNKGKCREYVANRRAALRGATPSWACREEMRSIHKLASDRGLVVDHIVPLVSDKVCGFNTPDNLRCITAELNSFKGNRYWSDMVKRK